LAAGAWFLNPLVFWSSSVHGEVDTFAALFVLGALVALERRAGLLTGALIGLGIFAKLYPVVLVPLAITVLVLEAPARSPGRVRWAPALRFAAGLALSAVPFLPLLSGFSVVLAHESGNVNFGGLSVLIVFNPNITSIARLWPTGSSAVVVAALEATALIGVIAPVVVLFLRRKKPLRFVDELPWLALLALGAIAGSLLAILSTQPENVVAVLAPLLVAAPLIGKYGRRLYWTVSFAAWAQYLTLLTPLAFFYPLWTDVGTGAVRWSNGIVVAYTLNQTPVPAGAFWIVLGVVGGGALIGVWVLGLTKTVGVLRRSPSLEASRAEALAGESLSSGATESPGRRAGIRRAPRPLGAAVAIFLVMTTVVAATTSVLVAAPAPPLRVALVGLESGSGTVTMTLRLSSGLAPVHVHVGVVPGFRTDRGVVSVFADPSYPDANGSYTASHEIAERVGLALEASGLSDPLRYVAAPGLPAALASEPTGTLLVLGGTVPDTVLSSTNASLAAWIGGGGTLVWAGGPLGGSAGHPSASGFVWDSPGWSGQLGLAGYPLTDPGPRGPLEGSIVSPLGAALGVAYNATPAGANTTELYSRGGVDLGVDTDPGPHGTAARSSLVYQPVGRGGIFFFGGSLWVSKHPPLVVPTATLTLSDDLALLLATGLVPTGGGGVHEDIELGSLATTMLSITVAGGVRPGGLVALVTAPTVPTFLEIWSRSLGS
ncbi:MAG TPA: glycosyltransferase family 87 protein, partial [Thermoplasmata archaeon]|nr:glycosyltransferase family 87 protein [Thermoplasmata archaeon]